MDHSAHQQTSHDLHASHSSHGQRGSLNALAASATLHCLTGCAIGEILGLMIGTALGLSTLTTVALAVALAFLFGYALSALPLLRAGMALGSALSLVLAADTLSILVMELVDNAVMAVVPGAMDAGLVNPVFWLAMMLALSVAFAAAYPVNRWLLARGKGHALMHEHHHSAGPSFLETKVLVAALVGFLLGGLTVSVAAELEDEPAPAQRHAVRAQ